MAKNSKKALSAKQQQDLLSTLQTRFEKNMNRHKRIEWTKVAERLKANKEKLW